MTSQSVIDYFDAINPKSLFSALLAKRGGYITFSNSGKRGSVKFFTLGLDSFITCLKDIIDNHESFKEHNNYVEHEWRDLGAEYFNDEAANALSTVQTKPLFTTINKLIFWANDKDINDYSDSTIELNKELLQNTLQKLEFLADLYSPKEAFSASPIIEETILITEKDLRQFALKTFKVLIEKFGEEKVLGTITEAEASVGDAAYTAIKIKPYFGSGNIIGVFESPQTRETLSSSGTQRYFEKNLDLKNYEYSYFSTQWADVESGTLTFNNFQRFINDITGGHFEAGKTDDHYSLIQKNKLTKNPVQKIYYGAPGTGKSYIIEEKTSDIPDNQKERITFHPEYDYSSFVGGYRPYSEEDTEGKLHVLYKFIPQVFTNIYVEAWKNPHKDYYLIIEEINRGNCAEIFGDLFQLLDRNSKYTISPSKDLIDYLNKQLVSKASEGIEGNKMKLPNNLNILASMNTSDQSLFPMDSAFKRRWSWEYVPINYEEINNNSFNFTVELEDGSYFKWIEFIEKVNNIIKRNPNLGTDKCIGNYFIKPVGTQISLEEFINKAIFYLWIDVFKDEEESIFKHLGEGITYEDFFPLVKGKELVNKLITYLEIKPVDVAKESEI